MWTQPQGVYNHRPKSCGHLLPGTVLSSLNRWTLVPFLVTGSHVCRTEPLVWVQCVNNKSQEWRDEAAQGLLVYCACSVKAPFVPLCIYFPGLDAPLESRVIVSHFCFSFDCMRP